MSGTARVPRQAEDGDYWPSDGQRGGRGRKGGSRSGGRRGGSGGRRKRYFGAAAGVLVIAVVAVVAVLVLRGGSKGGSGDGGTVTEGQPTVYVTQPTTDETAAINNRAKDDPRALNAGEIFTTAAQQVTAEGYTFKLVAKDLTSDCSSVVFGTHLKADLTKYGCSQISRIAYLSSDGKYSGQAIAINLATLQGSENILRDLSPGTASFVKPLPGAGIKDFGAGFSAAYPSSIGHYALIPWVQLNGGAKPTTITSLLSASLAVENGNYFVWQRLVDAAR